MRNIAGTLLINVRMLYVRSQIAIFKIFHCQVDMTITVKPAKKLYKIDLVLHRLELEQL